MTSREQILNRIEKNKPVSVALPEIPIFQESAELARTFGDCLKKIGGTLVELNGIASIQEFLQHNFPTHSSIATSFLPTALTIDQTTDKHILENVELAVLHGEFGVAENGAIWLPESAMLHRTLPFITQQLLIVLQKDALVSTMHQAYEKINLLPSYGVFIAGPSKTADIEQSLVIGAHGARSMTVILY